MEISGKPPRIFQGAVILSWKEDIERISTGVYEGNESTKVLFRHGGAPRGGPASLVTPDVEENCGSGSRQGFWVGIMGDVEFERVRVVILAHLRLFLPDLARFMPENEVAVVVARGWIFHPEVATGHPAIS